MAKFYSLLFIALTFIILQLCEATDICPFAKIPDEINEYPTLQLVCPCFEKHRIFS
jgi:hypothetical protein